MLETHAHFWGKVITRTVSTLYLGLITGGAFRAISVEMYFSWSHALWIFLWLPSMATVMVYLFETYWPGNPFGYGTPEHWRPFWIKVALIGLVLSYLGAIPIYLIRHIFS